VRLLLTAGDAVSRGRVRDPCAEGAQRKLACPLDTSGSNGSASGTGRRCNSPAPDGAW
jgi:hypothetical protein